MTYHICHFILAYNDCDILFSGVGWVKPQFDHKDSGVGWVKPQFDHKDNFLYGHYIMTYNDI